MRAPTSITLREAAEAWLVAADAGLVRTRSGSIYKPSTLRTYQDEPVPAARRSPSATSPTTATSHRYSGSLLQLPRLRRADPLPREPLRRMPASSASQPASTDRRSPPRTAPASPTSRCAIRSASNPGGQHHEWVKTRFVDPATRRRRRLPALPADRQPPHRPGRLLAHRSPAATRRTRTTLHGDWEIPDDGELFQRDWFTIIEPTNSPTRQSRCATGTSPQANPHPATPTPTTPSGSASSSTRRPASSTSPTSSASARPPARSNSSSPPPPSRDGRDVTIVIEQEAGGAGKALTDRYNRHILRGYNVRADRVTGPKYIRAQPVAAAAENGLVRARPQPLHPGVPRRTQLLPPRPPRRLRRRTRRRPPASQQGAPARHARLRSQGPHPHPYRPRRRLDQ